MGNTRRADLGLRPGVKTDSQLEGMALEDAERYLIERALLRFEGNVSLAAESLGLSRSALYRRLEKYELN